MYKTRILIARFSVIFMATSFIQTKTTDDDDEDGGN